MKRNFLFCTNSSKVDECHFLQSKQRLDLSKLQHFSFCMNCAYAIFDSQLLTWQPNSKNLFSDNLDFLSSEPVEYTNIGKKKIKKIFCNNSVVHAISEEGNVYSWGNDNEKTGVLGLGGNFNQNTPVLNPNLANKKIVNLSLSEKHGCAIDQNQRVYSWGTGKNGELGQGTDYFCDVPREIIFNERYYILNIQAGNTYTAFINAQSNVLYFGEISHPESLSHHMSNISFVTANNIKIIENINVASMFCGPALIALIDLQGFLYFYNDSEKLYKVKIDKKIKQVQFTNYTIYALTSNNDFVYELIVKSLKPFQMKNNFYENLYKVNPEFSSKLRLIDLPYFINFLFFSTECSQNSKEKIEKKERMMLIPIKIQKKNTILKERQHSNNKYENFLNQKNNENDKTYSTFNNNNNYTNISITQSRIEAKDINININLTEHYDNSNISVFPANKKHSKDNTLISEHSQFNNTSIRHHSMNPYNKKGQRIQKIYSLLGHIFDKKIEEIEGRFSKNNSQQRAKYVDLERVRPGENINRKPYDPRNKRFQNILEEDSYYSEENEEKRSFARNESQLEYPQKKEKIRSGGINIHTIGYEKTADFKEFQDFSKMKKPQTIPEKDELKLGNDKKKIKIHTNYSLQQTQFNKTTFDLNPLSFSKNYNVNPIQSAKLEEYRYANISDAEEQNESNNHSNNSSNRDIDIYGYDHHNIFSPPLKMSFEANKNEDEKPVFQVSSKEVYINIAKDKIFENLAPIEPTNLKNFSFKENQVGKFSKLEICKEQNLLEVQTQGKLYSKNNETVQLHPISIIGIKKNESLEVHQLNTFNDSNIIKEVSSSLTITNNKKLFDVTESTDYNIKTAESKEKASLNSVVHENFRNSDKNKNLMLIMDENTFDKKNSSNEYKENQDLLNDINDRDFSDSNTYRSKENFGIKIDEKNDAHEPKFEFNLDLVNDNELIKKVKSDKSFEDDEKTLLIEIIRDIKDKDIDINEFSKILKSKNMNHQKILNLLTENNLLNKNNEIVSRVRVDSVQNNNNYENKDSSVFKRTSVTNKKSRSSSENIEKLTEQNNFNEKKIDDKNLKFIKTDSNKSDYKIKITNRNFENQDLEGISITDRNENVNNKNLNSKKLKISVIKTNNDPRKNTQYEPIEEIKENNIFLNIDEKNKLKRKSISFKKKDIFEIEENNDNNVEREKKIVHRKLRSHNQLLNKLKGKFSNIIEEEEESNSEIQDKNEEFKKETTKIFETLQNHEEKRKTELPKDETVINKKKISNKDTNNLIEYLDHQGKDKINENNVKSEKITEFGNDNINSVDKLNSIQSSEIIGKSKEDNRNELNDNLQINLKEKSKPKILKKTKCLESVENKVVTYYASDECKTNFKSNYHKKNKDSKYSIDNIENNSDLIEEKNENETKDEVFTIIPMFKPFRDPFHLSKSNVNFTKVNNDPRTNEIFHSTDNNNIEVYQSNSKSDTSNQVFENKKFILENRDTKISIADQNNFNASSKLFEDLNVNNTNNKLIPIELNIQIEKPNDNLNVKNDNSNEGNISDEINQKENNDKSSHLRIEETQIKNTSDASNYIIFISNKTSTIKSNSSFENEIKSENLDKQEKEKLIKSIFSEKINEDILEGFELNDEQVKIINVSDLSGDNEDGKNQVINILNVDDIINKDVKEGLSSTKILDLKDFIECSEEFRIINFLNQKSETLTKKEIFEFIHFNTKFNVEEKKILIDSLTTNSNPTKELNNILVMKLNEKLKNELVKGNFANDEQLDNILDKINQNIYNKLENDNNEKPDNQNVDCLKEIVRSNKIESNRELLKIIVKNSLLIKNDKKADLINIIQNGSPEKIKKEIEDIIYKAENLENEKKDSLNSDVNEIIGISGHMKIMDIVKKDGNLEKSDIQKIIEITFNDEKIDDKKKNEILNIILNNDDQTETKKLLEKLVYENIISKLGDVKSNEIKSNELLCLEGSDLSLSRIVKSYLKGNTDLISNEIKILEIVEGKDNLIESDIENINLIIKSDKNMNPETKEIIAELINNNFVKSNLEEIKSLLSKSISTKLNEENKKNKNIISHSLEKSVFEFDNKTVDFSPELKILEIINNSESKNVDDLKKILIDDKSISDIEKNKLLLIIDNNKEDSFKIINHTLINNINEKLSLVMNKKIDINEKIDVSNLEVVNIKSIINEIIKSEVNENNLDKELNNNQIEKDINNTIINNNNSSDTKNINNNITIENIDENEKSDNNKIIDNNNDDKNRLVEIIKNCNNLSDLNSVIDNDDTIKNKELLKSVIKESGIFNQTYNIPSFDLINNNDGQVNISSDKIQENIITHITNHVNMNNINDQLEFNETIKDVIKSEVDIITMINNKIDNEKIINYIQNSQLIQDDIKKELIVNIDNPEIINQILNKNIENRVNSVILEIKANHIISSISENNNNYEGLNQKSTNIIVEESILNNKYIGLENNDNDNNQILDSSNQVNKKYEDKINLLIIQDSQIDSSININQDNKKLENIIDTNKSSEIIKNTLIQSIINNNISLDPENISNHIDISTESNLIHIINNTELTPENINIIKNLVIKDESLNGREIILEHLNNDKLDINLINNIIIDSINNKINQSINKEKESIKFINTDTIIEKLNNEKINTIKNTLPNSQNELIKNEIIIYDMITSNNLENKDAIKDILINDKNINEEIKQKLINELDNQSVINISNIGNILLQSLKEKIDKTNNFENSIKFNEEEHKDQQSLFGNKDIEEETQNLKNNQIINKSNLDEIKDLIVFVQNLEIKDEDDLKNKLFIIGEKVENLVNNNVISKDFLIEEPLISSLLNKDNLQSIIMKVENSLSNQDDCIKSVEINTESLKNIIQSKIKEFLNNKNDDFIIKRNGLVESNGENFENVDLNKEFNGLLPQEINKNLESFIKSKIIDSDQLIDQKSVNFEKKILDLNIDNEIKLLDLIKKNGETDEKLKEIISIISNDKSLSNNNKINDLLGAYKINEGKNMSLDDIQLFNEKLENLLNDNINLKTIQSLKGLIEFDQNQISYLKENIKKAYEDSELLKTNQIILLDDQKDHEIITNHDKVSEIQVQTDIKENLLNFILSKDIQDQNKDSIIKIISNFKFPESENISKNDKQLYEKIAQFVIENGENTLITDLNKIIEDYIKENEIKVPESKITYPNDFTKNITRNDSFKIINNEYPLKSRSTQKLDKIVVNDINQIKIEGRKSIVSEMSSQTEFDNLNHILFQNKRNSLQNNEFYTPAAFNNLNIRNSSTQSLPNAIKNDGFNNLYRNNLDQLSILSNTEENLDNKTLEEKNELKSIQQSEALRRKSRELTINKNDLNKNIINDEKIGTFNQNVTKIELIGNPENMSTEDKLKKLNELKKKIKEKNLGADIDQFKDVDTFVMKTNSLIKNDDEVFIQSQLSSDNCKVKEGIVKKVSQTSSKFSVKPLITNIKDDEINDRNRPATTKYKSLKKNSIDGREISSNLSKAYKEDQISNSHDYENLNKISKFNSFGYNQVYGKKQEKVDFISSRDADDDISRKEIKKNYLNNLNLLESQEESLTEKKNESNHQEESNLENFNNNIRFKEEKKNSEKNDQILSQDTILTNSKKGSNLKHSNSNKHKKSLSNDFKLESESDTQIKQKYISPLKKASSIYPEFMNEQSFFNLSEIEEEDYSKMDSLKRSYNDLAQSKQESNSQVRTKRRTDKNSGKMTIEELVNEQEQKTSNSNNLIKEKPNVKKNFRNSLDINTNTLKEKLTDEIISENEIDILKNLSENKKFIDFLRQDDQSIIDEKKLQEKKTFEKNLNKYLRLIEENKILEEDDLARHLIQASSCEENSSPNTPTDIRKKLIKNLENFKIGNVELKLQKLFQKYNKLGTISPFSNNCLTPKQNFNDDNDKLSELEPLELDKSQMTIRAPSHRLSQENLNFVGLSNLLDQHPKLLMNFDKRGSQVLDLKILENSKKTTNIKLTEQIQQFESGHQTPIKTKIINEPVTFNPKRKNSALKVETELTSKLNSGQKIGKRNEINNNLIKKSQSKERQSQQTKLTNERKKEKSCSENELSLINFMKNEGPLSSRQNESEGNNQSRLSKEEESKELRNNTSSCFVDKKAIVNKFLEMKSEKKVDRRNDYSKKNSVQKISVKKITNNQTTNVINPNNVAKSNLSFSRKMNLDSAEFGLNQNNSLKKLPISKLNHENLSPKNLGGTFSNFNSSKGKGSKKNLIIDSLTKNAREKSDVNNSSSQNIESNNQVKTLNKFNSVSKIKQTKIFVKLDKKAK